MPNKAELTARERKHETSKKKKNYLENIVINIFVIKKN